ncbi:MAG: C_GCAxxG_C_C family protein [Lachnospiraceae bacterium]|nr:C_GCAxxG_C_C family protein [Lachnospiraceae bacterium]
MKEKQGKSKKEIATEYYESNFNCAQAVFTTFATEKGIPEELALKIGTQFGGGCRKGEVCGAVSGALMVLGLLCGHCHRNAPEEKAEAYGIGEEFMNRFIEKNGTVVCRELLGYDLTKPEDKEKIRELGLFQSMCPKMVQSATETLEEMLAGKGLL